MENKGGPGDSVVATWKSVGTNEMLAVTAEDLMKLGDRNREIKDRWLSSRTIDLWLQVVQSSQSSVLEDVEVHDYSTIKWITTKGENGRERIRTGRSKKTFTKKINVFPFHKGNHWSAIIHSRAGTLAENDKIWILDSDRKNSTEDWRRVTKEVDALHDIFPSVERAETFWCNVPRQKDTWNCGVHTLVNIINVLRGINPINLEFVIFEHNEMENTRAEIAEWIINVSILQDKERLVRHFRHILDSMKFANWCPLEHLQRKHTSIVEDLTTPLTRELVARRLFQSYPSPSPSSPTPSSIPPSSQSWYSPSQSYHTKSSGAASSYSLKGRKRKQGQDDIKEDKERKKARRENREQHPSKHKSPSSTPPSATPPSSTPPSTHSSPSPTASTPTHSYHTADSDAAYSHTQMMKARRENMKHTSASSRSPSCTPPSWHSSYSPNPSSPIQSYHTASSDAAYYSQMRKRKQGKDDLPEEREVKKVRRDNMEQHPSRQTSPYSTPSSSHSLYSRTPSDRNCGSEEDEKEIPLKKKLVKGRPYSPSTSSQSTISPCSSPSFPSQAPPTPTSDTTMQRKEEKKKKKMKKSVAKRNVHKQIGKNREEQMKFEQNVNSWLQETHTCYWDTSNTGCEKADATKYRYSRKCRQELVPLIGRKSKGKKRSKVCDLQGLERYKQQLKKKKTAEEMTKFCYLCQSSFDNAQDKENHVEIFHNTCDKLDDCKEMSVACVWFRVQRNIYKGEEIKMQERRVNKLGYVKLECLKGYSGQKRWTKKKAKQNKKQNGTEEGGESCEDEDGKTAYYVVGTGLKRGRLRGRGRGRGKGWGRVARVNRQSPNREEKQSGKQKHLAYFVCKEFILCSCR